MRIYILTLFPDMIMNTLSESITGRAMKQGYLEIHAVNIRDYTDDKNGRVDDYPYGGGAGMVMRAQPVYDCYEAVVSGIGHKPRTILLAPHGRTFSAAIAHELAEEEDMILICGHYEGIDERVIEEIDPEVISIGDYVLTGGELPAMVLADAVARLVPGVLHNSDSAAYESFEDGLLEHPQYTRPEEWRGRKVPPILLSGDHAKVDQYRYDQSVERTKRLRPDILGNT
ncbi:MAG: tRNA (guanosine(37)-N1)-methyltransferase TrmD [Lachnospiraceae bacterium]|nr:tRNA (guanosine(37)-N1)-methyltransferase TrmD [Lachnospiraceae bacterium]